MTLVRQGDHRHPTRQHQPRGRHHRQRPRAGHAATAPAHRNRLPPRRRTRAASLRSRHRTMPGPAPRKGRNHTMAAGLPTLMRHLLIHGQERGHRNRIDQLLSYRNGNPLTRRYDHLWLRLGKHLPWVSTQQISTHWLRHTTLTWVERNFGYAGHNGKTTQAPHQPTSAPTSTRSPQHSPHSPQNPTHLPKNDYRRRRIRYARRGRPAENRAHRTATCCPYR